jgi:enolase
MDSKIKSVRAREVLDSRGNPTIEVEVEVSAGKVRAIAPSGASTGAHEALELRDGGSRFLGKGVQKAVGNANTGIAKAIIGLDATKQYEVDKAMVSADGTKNKGRFGANATVAASMAVCRAGALAKGIPLYKHISEIAGTKISIPIPQLNVINGGKHAGMENDIQENMYLPVKAESFSEGLRAAVETYHTLKKMLKEKYGVAAIHLGDEGGFVPPIASPKERLAIMVEAAKKAGHDKVLSIGLDPASSEFYYKDKNKYMIGKTEYTPDEMVGFYGSLVDEFPIVSIEDGMAEDDWYGWALINKKLGSRIQLTGDDLLVTNVERIKMAIEKKACNSLLLKVNQIGTIMESIEAAKMSMKEGWRVTVSHRSGETEDSFIADLAVGLGASQIKTGAPARSERTAKYNQLLRIEEELGGKAKYAGKEF